MRLNARSGSKSSSSSQQDRAQKFREDFLALVGADKLGNITGPALAGVIVDDLEMDSRWQIMEGEALEQLNAGESDITCESDQWKPIDPEVGTKEPDQEIDI